MWIGVPIACAGLAYFPCQLAAGSPSFSVLAMIVGFLLPAAGWPQREKFLGWRRYYLFANVAIVGLAIAISAFYRP